MTTRIAKLLLPFVLFTISRVVSAQALTYTDCTVKDVPSLVAAITNVYDATKGGVRPTVFLDQWIWNGEDPSTHRIITAYPDYATLEQARGRLAGNPAAAFAFGQSAAAVANCTAEGLAVQRGAWGNQNAQTPMPYFATFGISATDGAAYAAALDKLATSRVGKAAPGVILLFENRAGLSKDTHLVVLNAPTLAALNQYLDTLFASKEFADFNRSVSSIRTVTSRNQVFRMRAWTTPANN